MCALNNIFLKKLNNVGNVGNNGNNVGNVCLSPEVFPVLNPTDTSHGRKLRWGSEEEEALDSDCVLGTYLGTFFYTFWDTFL